MHRCSPWRAHRTWRASGPTRPARPTRLDSTQDTKPFYCFALSKRAFDPAEPLHTDRPDANTAPHSRHPLHDDPAHLPPEPGTCPSPARSPSASRGNPVAEAKRPASRPALMDRPPASPAASHRLIRVPGTQTENAPRFRVRAPVQSPPGARPELCSDSSCGKLPSLTQNARTHPSRARLPRALLASAASPAAPDHLFRVHEKRNGEPGTRVRHPTNKLPFPIVPARFHGHLRPLGLQCSPSARFEFRAASQERRQNEAKPPRTRTQEKEKNEEMKDDPMDASRYLSNGSFALLSMSVSTSALRHSRACEKENQRAVLSGREGHGEMLVERLRSGLGWRRYWKSPGDEGVEGGSHRWGSAGDAGKGNVRDRDPRELEREAGMGAGHRFLAKEMVKLSYRGGEIRMARRYTQKAISIALRGSPVKGFDAKRRDLKKARAQHERKRPRADNGGNALAPASEATQIRMSTPLSPAFSASLVLCCGRYRIIRVDSSLVLRPGVVSLTRLSIAHERRQSFLCAYINGQAIREGTHSSPDSKPSSNTQTLATPEAGGAKEIEGADFEKAEH
ncbi:hypothetical protein DFH06DRAFT_1124563 [Mycena polygramma]|nr:hypothetical protein DFH06DRAFT_1124563 [Mycena polygramma]